MVELALPGLDKTLTFLGRIVFRLFKPSYVLFQIDKRDIISKMIWPVIQRGQPYILLPLFLALIKFIEK